MDKEFRYENEGVIKNKKKRKKKKKKNVFLKILVRFILILIILIVIMVGVLIGYVYNKLSKIDYDEDGIENLVVNEGVEKTEEYLNVALFGVDTRSNKYDSSSGSDTILIVSLNQKTKEVKMVSVYRDSYLCLEDNKYDKLTDIYRRYGPEKAVNVLNRNLDLHISEYVTINFEVVAEVVNYVGGVQIDVGKADLQYINGYIYENTKVTGIKSSYIKKAGTQNLDGIQALAYARIRYVGTDINRAERQREVLMKTFEKVKKMNVVQLNGLVDKVLPKVKTTINKSKIVELALGVTQYNITTSEGFPYNWADYQPGEVYYLAPRNLEENVKKLHQALYAEEDYEVSNDLKKISNNLITKTGLK